MEKKAELLEKRLLLPSQPPFIS